MLKWAAAVFDDVRQGGFSDQAIADLSNPGRNLLVFVHGFANSFTDALTRAAFNREWLAASGEPGTDTTVIAFCWPSLGRTVGFPLPAEPYLADQHMARNSGLALMGFLAPAFLFGALAVGVPLYLHLLRRNTSIPLPFSSLMFFEKQAPNAVRRRRLRHWLLLALRLAVLLFLALAFAEPYLTRALPGVAPEKLLLVAIDDSFSMRAGTRLEDAKRQALELLSAKRAGDRAQVLSLEARVHLLTQTTQDMRTLRDAVNGIQPGDSRTNYGTLVSVVKSISENEHVPVEVHLFSDLQKTAMPASFSELTLPSGAIKNTPAVSVPTHKFPRRSSKSFTTLPPPKPRASCSS